MNIGIICPSEIALRRFMPSLLKCHELHFAGIGVYTKNERFSSAQIDDDTFYCCLQNEIRKTQLFTERYGGKIYNGYAEIASSKDIEALYIPLPPALHYKWAKFALEHGKHVLVEKPSTTSFADSNDLIQIALVKRLALHENYMFNFHSQLDRIEEIIQSGEIGEVRLYRICFGFPKRDALDFRYNKALGGGALLDAGGYTIMYATRLLGGTAKIECAQSNYLKGYEVDIYGSATLVNKEGVTAQIAFGMDNNYKCELEVWGSKGCLTTGRVLTAPSGFVPTAIIRKGNEEKVIDLPEDDAFFNSIQHFISCIKDEGIRKKRYSIINKQAKHVDEFKRLAAWK